MSEETVFVDMLGVEVKVGDFVCFSGPTNDFLLGTVDKLSLSGKTIYVRNKVTHNPFPVPKGSRVLVLNANTLKLAMLEKLSME